MRKADNKIILQQVLNHNISINSGQIEINSQPINHLKLIMLSKVLQDALNLRFRDIFNPAVLNELL